MSNSVKLNWARLIYGKNRKNLDIRKENVISYYCLIKKFFMYKPLSWNLKEEELNSRSPKNF